MKVKLKHGWSKTYPRLTVGNLYRVLGIEADNLRIVDDTGDPVLFATLAFLIVDATIPASWLSERDEDGALYAYPPELREPRYFFEEFHDYDADVRQKFSAYMHRLCHSESAAAPDPPNSYIRVEWMHDHADDPITLYSELDAERWEVRKIEMFRDGQVTWADAKCSTGTTRLGDQPVPAVAEIAADREFVVKEISRAEFEAAWDDAFESDEP